MNDRRSGSGSPYRSHAASSRATYSSVIRRGSCGGSVDDRRGQVGPEVEQLVLDPPQQLGEIGGQLTGGQGDADQGVGLVHVPVRRDPRIGLGRLRHVGQPGPPAVAGLGVDAGEVDHVPHGIEPEPTGASGSGSAGAGWQGWFVTAPSPWTRHRPRSVIAPVLIVTVVCPRRGLRTGAGGVLDRSIARRLVGAARPDLTQLLGQLLDRCIPLPSTIDPAPEDSEAPGSTDCEYVPTGTSARPVNPPPTTNVPNSGEVTATIQLNGGTVKVVLDRNAAPCTVNSFISLAQQKFYDKTTMPPAGRLRHLHPAVRRPDRLRYRRSGLHVRRRARRHRDLHGRGGGDGQRRPEHQRLPVLPRLRRLGASPRATPSSARWTASRRVIGTMAYEGQDGKNPAGGGRPNNPSEITASRLPDCSGAELVEAAER